MLLCKGWELGRKGRKNPTPSAAAASIDIGRGPEQDCRCPPMLCAFRIMSNIVAKKKRVYSCGVLGPYVLGIVQ
jgi:hypothetical protein